MVKTICVVGATGGQGGSVARLMAKESGWKVRGITRRPNSTAARALFELGIEVVTGDLDDQASLEKAFDGCQAIFGVTDFYDYFFDVGPEAAVQREFTQGCNIARAAAKTSSLEHLIWSTLPDTELLTQGKAVVPHFQGKGRVDSFIRDELPELSQKVTFALFGVFNINLVSYENCKPIYLPSVDKWIQTNAAPSDTPYPCLADHKVNTGVFVRNMVRNRPEPGTYIRCHVEDLTLDSYLKAWGRASGLAPDSGQILCLQLLPQQYNALWGSMGEELTTQWAFLDFMKEHNDSMPFQPLFGMDLLTEEEKCDLVYTEESLRAMDWSQFAETKERLRISL